MPLLDFSQRDDRYYLGNVLLKAGELSKELIDFTDDDKNNGMFRILKRIRNARIAHFPRLMVEGNDVEMGSSEMIRDQLFPIIARRLHATIAQLNAGEKVSLHSSVVAANIISRHLFTDKFSDIDAEMLVALNHANSDLGKEKKSHEVKDVKAPRALTLQNIEGLLRGILNQAQYLKAGKGLLRGVKRINNDIQRYHQVIEENPISLVAMEQMEINLLEPVYDEEGFRVFRELVNLRLDDVQKTSHRLEEEISVSEDVHEDEIMGDEWQDVEDDNVERLRQKLVAQLSILTKELAYLKNVKDDEGLSEEKKMHVMQFSLVKIVDLFKTIKVTQIENFSSSMSHATVFQKSISHSVAIRNKGVAHDIFSFNKDEFLKVIEQNTASFGADIKALADIIHFNYDVSKEEEGDVEFLQFSFGVMLNNVALCHVRLGNYAEAKKMMLEALAHFDDNNIVKPMPDMPGIAIADINLVLKYDQGNPSLSRFNKSLKIRKSDILKNLFGIYWHENDWEKSLQTANAIADLEIELEGRASCTSMSNQAVCLMKSGNKTASQKRFEQALHRSDNMTSTITILFNQICLFKEAKEYELCRSKVRELEAIVNADEIHEPEDKLNALIHLGAYYLEEGNNLDHATQLLENATDFLAENYGKIFDSTGNQILSFEAQMLAFKMNILTRQVSCSSLSKEFDPDKNVMHCDVLDETDAEKMEHVFKEWTAFLSLSKEDTFKVTPGAVLDLSAAFSNASKILQNSQDFIQDPSKALDYAHKALLLQEHCHVYSSATLFNSAAMHHILALNNQDPQTHLPKATHYFERALENGDFDDSTRVIIYQRMAEISDQTHSHNDAIMHYRKAFDILSEAGESTEEVNKALSASIRKEISVRYLKQETQEEGQEFIR